MNDRKRNILDALERIMYFGEANSQLSTDLPVTVGLLTANQENITRLHQAGITSVSAHGAGRSETRSKVARAREITSDLRKIAATARVMEKRLPGFRNSFVLPRGTLSYQEMAEVADSFLTDAPASAADFTKYGLPSQFFTELALDVEAFREISHEQADAKRTGIGVNADMEAILEQALDVREELNRIVRNFYRNEPQKLAEWLTASHIERRRRKDDIPHVNVPPVVVPGTMSG